MTTTHEIKDFRGRKTGTFLARLGQFEATGSSKREAQTALEAKIASFHSRSRYILCADGLTTMHVEAGPMGFGYSIIGRDRGNSPSCYCATGDSFDAALATARNHAETCYGGILADVA